MKTKILELLKGMTSDSKKESYKCEKELCKILADICNKLKTIESSVCYSVRFYPGTVYEIDDENAYTGIKNCQRLYIAIMGVLNLKPNG